MRGRGAEEQRSRGAKRRITMPNAQFPIPNAQCPMPNAPFPIPNSQLKLNFGEQRLVLFDC